MKRTVAEINEKKLISPELETKIKTAMASITERFIKMSVK